VPQAVSFDDLERMTALPPGQQPAPAKAISFDDLEQLAKAPAPAVAPKPEAKIPHFQDAAIPFFKSFYDEGIAPVLDMAKDAIDRGDLGESSVQKMLGAFKDQLWNFQQHPDIRNLPIVGTGATAIANRMQRQYNDGDYAGAAGTAAGFLGQFLTPDAAAALIDKLPEAAQAAAAAADATGNVAKATGKAASAGARAAAPDLLKAGLQAGASKVLGGHVPLAAFMGEMGALGRAGRGLQKGAQAAGEAWTAERAAQAAARAGTEAAPEAAAAEVPVQTGEATPDIWAGARAQNAARDATVTPNVWEKARAGNAPPGAELTLTPLDRAEGDVIDIRPEARTPEQMGAQPATEPESDLEAKLRASVEQAQAKHAAAQHLEDRIDEHHAYLTGQAEDILWANRARKADRFAQFLIENNLAATPANIDLAARHLAEKRAPSAETVPMIQDRVDWFNAKQQTVQ
jgi:hypothetical protein